jgi:hypothetical protein
MRTDLVCRARRGPLRGRVREVPLPLELAPGKDPRVGRLRRCNPDALNPTAIFASGEAPFVLALFAGD